MILWLVSDMICCSTLFETNEIGNICQNPRKAAQIQRTFVSISTNSFPLINILAPSPRACEGLQRYLLFALFVICIIFICIIFICIICYLRYFLFALFVICVICYLLFALFAMPVKVCKVVLRCAGPPTSSPSIRQSVWWSCLKCLKCCSFSCLVSHQCALR